MFLKTPVLSGSWRKWLCGQTSMRELCILYFLGGKIHTSAYQKTIKKVSFLSNPVYLILHYRAPIAISYCRCNSTLEDVAVTKKKWLRGWRCQHYGRCMVICVVRKVTHQLFAFFGFNMMLFNRIEPPWPYFLYEYIICI